MVVSTVFVFTLVTWNIFSAATTSQRGYPVWTKGIKPAGQTGKHPVTKKQVIFHRVFLQKWWETFQEIGILVKLGWIWTESIFQPTNPIFPKLGWLGGWVGWWISDSVNIWCGRNCQELGESVKTSGSLVVALALAASSCPLGGSWVDGSKPKAVFEGREHNISTSF